MSLLEDLQTTLAELGIPVETAKNKLIRLLLRDDFTITGRLYNGYETETGYHHYTVDVAKHYEMEV